MQQDKTSNFTFFQWKEFWPSAGLTAGLGSVRVSSGAPVRSIEKNPCSLHLPYWSTFSIMTIPCQSLLLPYLAVWAISALFLHRYSVKRPKNCLWYAMHNWAPYWLFTMSYACVQHFNLWRGHKHPCSFQLHIALNLKSARHYVGIDLVPYIKSHTSAQHNCKT